MPATTSKKKKRTWAGLVCPICRFVFRVPKDHDGAGVICPACHHLLNIPGSSRRLVPAKESSEDSLETLQPPSRDAKKSKPIVSRPLSEKDTIPQGKGDMAPTDQTLTKANGTSFPAPKNVRRKKRSKPAPEWENKSAGRSTEAGNPMAWIVGGTLLGLALVGVGAWLVMDSDDSSDDIALSDLDGIAAQPALITEDEMTAEEKKRQREIENSVKTGMSVLTDTEEQVRKFLNAKTSAELETLVRTPDVTIPRMRGWYREQSWVPPGVKDIGYGGRVTIKGLMASMDVRLNDFSVKQIALENTPDGYKIDWESWVAWSAMKWDDLFQKKPTDPVEVRVNCTLSSYYNRLFSDDTKWVSVKLEHPDSERVIYGYIDNDSPALMRMVPELKQRGVLAATITIRYPKDTRANNQVYISEFLQTGWVRPTDESPSDPAASEEEE